MRPVDYAVEGLLDAAVVRKLFATSKIPVGRNFGGSGKNFILSRLSKWNQAAKYSPWFVMVDLDQEACVPLALKNWLPAPSPLMRFRIAVKEVESWLLADRAGLGEFLGFDPTKIPLSPDELEDPKSALLTLCRSSNDSSVKKDMLPRDNYKSLEGPAYASRLTSFVGEAWNPKEARKVSPSLDKCLTTLKAFRATL
jgi:hypothetical protein